MHFSDDALEKNWQFSSELRVEGCFLVFFRYFLVFSYSIGKYRNRHLFRWELLFEIQVFVVDFSLDHFLCSRNLLLKKTASDWRQKMVLFAVKRRLFNPSFFNYDFQLDQTVEKISTQLAGGIHASEINVSKFRRLGSFLSETVFNSYAHHTPTPQHRRCRLSCCHFCCSSARGKVMSHYIYARQQHVAEPDGRSARYRWSFFAN